MRVNNDIILNVYPFKIPGYFYKIKMLVLLSKNTNVKKPEIRESITEVACDNSQKVS